MLLLELITGVVIIEQIFSIPGIGRLLVQSVLMRDIPLIQGLIFYTSTFVVLFKFCNRYTIFFIRPKNPSR